MPLPRIQSLTPVTTPPRPALLFPDLYMRSLRIEARPDRPWRAVAELVPYDYASNTLAPPDQIEQAAQHLELEDLQAQAARSPLVAQVLGGVLAAVNLLCLERAQLARLEQALARLAQARQLDANDPNRPGLIAAAEAARDQANAALRETYQQLGVSVS